MTHVVRSTWQVSARPDPIQANLLATQLRIPEELAGLLIQRGIDDADRAKVFLRPTLTALSEPKTLVDLEKAVDIIVAAVRHNDTIMVHGDYDVDGQCSTAILTRVLRAAGATVVPFVPHRMTDGYDLGTAGVRVAIEHGVSVIVTCDCGVTAVASVAQAKAAGMKVVVTDHHLPTVLPAADAIVNPKRQDCPSEFKEFCGAGLAFKLAQGLVTALDLPDNLPMHFLDLVALATVADLVPLTGENRTLVRYGLRALANSRWPGVRALVAAAGLEGKPLKAGQVGFILAPRLNAIGRLGDAKDGLALLLTDDEDEARTRANSLETINKERQDVDRVILEQAKKRVDTHVDLDNVFGLVLADDSWHPGVIGIVASRMVELYARPTVMIGLEGDLGKGSGRSLPGFDLHGGLTACQSLLVKFGGHHMAAGLTIGRKDVPAFQEAFNEAVKAKLAKDELVHRRRIDALTSIHQLGPDLGKLLQYFEPCGMGNPAPVFGVERARARNAKSVGQRHLRFTLEDDTGRLAAIAFGQADVMDEGWFAGDVDVALRLEENEWRGSSTLQARIIDLRPGG